MADWPILGWLVHLVDDTPRHGLRADRHGARCWISVSNTVRGTSRLHPAAFLSDEAMREDRATALEVPVVNLWLLSRTGIPFLSSAVAERSAGDHPASLSTGNPDQSQARDFHFTFVPPSRLRPRRVTSRGGIRPHRRRSSLHLKPASVTSLIDRFFYQRPYLEPLDVPLGCLKVARHPLCLGQGNFPRASARGREDTPSRPAVPLPHTRFLVLPGQRRYAVRVATFLERRIAPQTRHNVSSRRRLLIDAQPLGTNFARNKSDEPAYFAWQALLFSLKPDS